MFDFLDVEAQRLRFVVGRIGIALNHGTYLVFKGLHSLRMTAYTGKSVAHRRVAGCRVGNDVYRRFIQTETGCVDKVISLQTVWQIEDDLPTIVREIKRVGKDVLCPDTPGKVVAFPVRPIARGMPFHHPVVIGDPRIVETSPAKREPPGAVDKVSGDINLQSQSPAPYPFNGSESRS